MWIYNLLPTFLFLAYLCLGKEAIESLQASSYSHYKCIKDQGFNKSLINVQGYDWSLDMNAVRKIQAAKNAGL